MIETSTLYGGEVTLEFNPGRHLYTWDGKKVDGVTSVLGVINKPALLGWAANCAVDHLMAAIQPGMVYDAITLEDLALHARKAYATKRDKAAETGTQVHQWIEDYIKGKQPDMPNDTEVLNGVLAFKRWVDSRHVEFICSERKIMSRRYCFGGTLDFEALIDGKLYLGDIKTSSAIYPEMFLQTSAYQMARQEEEPGLEYAGQIIVNCRKDGTLDVQESTQYDVNSKAFLAALILYRRVNEMKAENRA